VYCVVGFPVYSVVVMSCEFHVRFTLCILWWVYPVYSVLGLPFVFCGKFAGILSSWPSVKRLNHYLHNNSYDKQHEMFCFLGNLL